MAAPGSSSLFQCKRALLRVGARRSEKRSGVPEPGGGVCQGLLGQPPVASCRRSGEGEVSRASTSQVKRFASCVAPQKLSLSQRLPGPYAVVTRRRVHPTRSTSLCRRRARVAGRQRLALKSHSARSVEGYGAPTRGHITTNQHLGRRASTRVLEDVEEVYGRLKAG